MNTASHPLELDLSGRTLERYRLIRRLGIGGMGTVYEAEHTKLEKRVAVKVLRHEFTSQEIARKRFLREAKAATRVKHPNVVDISDFGETDDGHVFFAMELLTGKDLGDFLKEEGRLPWEQTQKILLQVVSALDAAHAQGIVHRDMKPSNCFLVDIPGLESTDFIKVLDFGIAKVLGAGEQTNLTSTDEVFGTVAYMSPEMAMGISDDPRSDIYAVGVMMYRMLTGDVPFTQGNAFQILSQHINTPPPLPREVEPSIPQAIEAIILKALEKGAEDRFQTMRELADALRRGEIGAPTLPVSTPAKRDGPNTDASKAAGLRADGAQLLTVPAGVITASTASTASTTVAMDAVHASSSLVVAQSPAKVSRTRIPLFALVGLVVGLGIVTAGMALRDKEDAAVVVAPATAPSEMPEPSVSEPAPVIEKSGEVAPSPPSEDQNEGNMRGEVPTPALVAADEDAEIAVDDDAGEEEEDEDDDLVVLDDESEDDRQAPTPSETPTPKKKPRTDAAVIANLKRRIAARCTEDGSTTVRLEGLIRNDGRMQGTLATPKTGPGACAEEVLETARFAPREAMKAMPMFSVKL